MQQVNTPTKLIRVLIVDDHNLFRSGVVRLLESEADMLVSSSASVSEAMEVLTSQPVDVVLLDYDLGEERGTDLVQRIREHGIHTRVLVVTAGLTARQAAELMQKGIAGIFPKTDSPRALVEAIRKVNAGEAWLKQDHLQLLLDNLSEPARQGEKTLSARERAVLRGVVDGLANKEIATELQISESSVKAALQQVFTKTGVRTRSQLVRVALDRYRDLVL